MFKIVSESGVAAGVRRIEAVSGEGALSLVHQMGETLNLAAASLKTNPDKLIEKLQQLTEKTKATEKEVKKLKDQLAGSSGNELGASAVQVGEVMVVAEMIEGADVETLRNAVDKLKDKLQTAAIVLASVEDGKVRIIAGVTKALSKDLKAGQLVNHVANQVGSKGGGRPDMAQAGGDQPENLPAALASVTDWVTTQLG